MNILVTGSTGFVGRHLIPKLVCEHKVMELTIEPQASEMLYKNTTQKTLVTEDQSALCDAIGQFKPEIVIHLASFLTSSDSYQDMQTLINSNLLFLCRVLDALKTSGIKLFINTGTFAEYKNGDETLDPAYLYAATKTASRSIVRYYSNVYNFKHTTVVPYTLYGGNDSQKKIIDLIYDSLFSDEPIALSPGLQKLDFIHIDDITDLYIQIINHFSTIPNETNFQAGTGITHSLRELAGIFEKVTNKKTNITWGAKPYRESDVMYAAANTKKQQDLLHWSPKISLEQGIRGYCDVKKDIL